MLSLLQGRSFRVAFGSPTCTLTDSHTLLTNTRLSDAAVLIKGFRAQPSGKPVRMRMKFIVEEGWEQEGWMSWELGWLAGWLGIWKVLAVKSGATLSPNQLFM